MQHFWWREKTQKRVKGTHHGKTVARKDKFTDLNIKWEGTKRKITGQTFSHDQHPPTLSLAASLARWCTTWCGYGATTGG